MTQGLSDRLSLDFEAVVDGDSYLPGDEPAEVATAPPMPDETAAAESGQPGEEVNHRIPTMKYT